MISKLIREDEHNSSSRPSVVCSVRGAPGLHWIFPPFELLFSRKTQGVLDLIKKTKQKKLGGRSKPISKNEIQKTWEQSY